MVENPVAMMVAMVATHTIYQNVWIDNTHLLIYSRHLLLLIARADIQRKPITMATCSP